MQRFFVSPKAVAAERVTLDGELAHQIAHVLRLTPGDHILVLDNSGWQMETELTEVSGQQVAGSIVRRSLARGEPRIKISLYQGILRANHLEFALQKGAELGVVEFVPMITSRCVIANLDDVNKKSERWERIIREAAELSQRGRLPHLEPALMFMQACERARNAGGLFLLPWEEEKEVSLQSVLSASPLSFTISLFVGPEGGFTGDEARLARAYGARTVSLGPRILRAETAGLVAAAIMLYVAGDMQPARDHD